MSADNATMWLLRSRPWQLRSPRLPSGHVGLAENFANVALTQRTLRMTQKPKVNAGTVKGVVTARKPSDSVSGLKLANANGTLTYILPHLGLKGLQLTVAFHRPRSRLCPSRRCR